MSSKNKPGIHLMKRVVYIEDLKKNKSWYWWRIVANNGRIIARSSETYTRKRNAIKSMLIAAGIFLGGKPYELIPYFDHSKPGSPLKYF